MVQSDIQLVASSIVIRDEIVRRANTALRVGGLFNDLSDSKINIDAIDTDPTLAANSDEKLPSQEAVKAYVDSAIQTVKVSLTSAEILALFTTPKQLIPAPGAGKMLVPLSYFYVYTF